MKSPVNPISVQLKFPSPVTAMMLAGFSFSCITVKEAVYIIVSASLFDSISEHCAGSWMSRLGGIGIISVPSGRPREFGDQEDQSWIKGCLLWGMKMWNICWDIQSTCDDAILRRQETLNYLVVLDLWFSCLWIDDKSGSSRIAPWLSDKQV